MKIQSINNNSYSSYRAPQPSFKAFKREVTKITSPEVLWRNNTAIFRNDMAWGELIKFLEEKYANVEKVHVYNYACSNGLETYSFLMELLSNHDEKTIKKFTPIIAKDFDNFAVSMANSKLVDIEDFEIERINAHTNGRFKDFFYKNSHIEGKYSPTNKLTPLVSFGLGDFTKEYNTLPKDNIIIIVRNCWPYFSQDDIENLPQKLYEHLGKNTTLITGNYDFLNLGYRKFRDSGFKQTYIPYVYEK
jgi:chemotaxis methyl-accepting protein methylase